jgi:hypothetical protein
VQNIIKIEGLGIKMSKAIWSQDSKAKMSNINGNRDSRIEMSMVKTRQKKLESYFCSNHDASNPSPIIVLAYIFLLKKILLVVKTITFQHLYTYYNPTIKLASHGGLPIYMPLVLKVCEIADLGEDTKPPKIKLKKSYKSSQKCQDICDV